MGFLVTAVMTSTPHYRLVLAAVALLLLATVPLAPVAAQPAAQPEVTINHHLLQSLGPLRSGRDHLRLHPPGQHRASSRRHRHHEALRHRRHQTAHRRHARRHYMHRRHHTTHRRHARRHYMHRRARIVALPPPRKPIWQGTAAIGSPPAEKPVWRRA
ncbi:MAG: hypothetical protein ACREE3_06375, partial [Stellaceae bacterium]